MSCDRVRHLRRGSVLRSKGESLSGSGLGYDGGAPDGGYEMCKSKIFSFWGFEI